MSVPSTDGPGSVVERLVAALVVGVVGAVGVAAAWVAFVRFPDSLVEFLGVVAVVAVALPVLWLGSRLAESATSPYNVAEVAVEGPIARERRGGLRGRAVGVGADAVVEQVDRADADASAEALLVKLNTPGGEIVPSEDVRLAVERFDGPTVGYATDVCASGGYDVASGCDEVWARDGTLVGSIGVIGSQVNVHELAERLGVSYEQFTAGAYKDAGAPLKELDDDERAYLQGLVDDYYDRFVESVAEKRDLDRATVEGTEARVFLGTEARECGLVDAVGTRADVEERLEERLGERVRVREFEPQRPLRERIRVGTGRLARAFGAGVADAVGGDVDGVRFRR